MRDLQELYDVRGQYLETLLRRMLLEDVLHEMRYLNALEKEKEKIMESEELKFELMKVEVSVLQLRENVKAYAREFQAVKDVLDLSMEEVEEYIGIKGLSKRVKGLRKANCVVKEENESVAKRLRVAIAGLRKAKTVLKEVKSIEERERRRRMTLEGQCRKMAAEISSKRKEVKAMKSAWATLQGQAGELKQEADRIGPEGWATVHHLISTGPMEGDKPAWNLEGPLRKQLADLNIKSELVTSSSEAIT